MKVVVVGVRADSLLSFRGELLRAMSASGHDVLALAPEDNPAVRAELRAMGVAFGTVPLRRTSLNPVMDVLTVVSLARTFRARRTDAVLVYAAKPVIYGSIAARLARVPMRAAMVTGVGSALGGASGLQRRILASLMRGLYAVALRQARVVFFQNGDDESLFRSLGLLGTRSRVVRVNGSGVDLAYFSPAPLPPAPMTFLMIGRLIRDKGVAEYVEAARRVRTLRPEAKFHLLGALDPNPSAISSEELAAWRREGIVEYLGTAADVRPIISAAHVCVLPSYGEGMSRFLLEALATGRAVVTTDVPGCRDTVDPGRNGLLVPARDPVALADAMLSLLDDPGQLESMGRRSRAMAERRFDVHDVNRTIMGEMGLA